MKITEEKLSEDCIAKLETDKKSSKNNNNNNTINYQILNKNYQSFFDIDNTGCIRLKNKEINNESEIINLKIQPYDNVDDKNENNSSNKITYHEIKINIELTNKNYYAPELIEDDKTLLWMEKQFPGVIKKLEAFDLDKNLNGPPFTYQLNPNKNNDTIKSKFNLSTDGILTGKVIFDYNDINIYNISILITDNGKPKKTGESFISLHIIKTDKKLEFYNVKDSLIISQNDNQYYKSSPLSELKLKNKNNQVKFYITSGNTDNYFRIDPIEGNIYVNNFNNFSLNHDKEYNLTITAKDGIFIATKELRIIIKVNNKGPEFKKWVDNIDIVINKNYSDNCLAIVKAIDPDIQDENVDHKIRYGISEEQYFTIDDNGCIKLRQIIKKNLINEYNIRNSTVLVVRAFDNALNDGHLETNLKININLIDVNKKIPNFQLENKQFFIDEDSSPGLIGHLKIARCEDNCNNFKFSIDTSKKLGKEVSNLFNITRDCQLNSTVIFQWKEKRHYEVPIVITNVKSSESSEAILEIKINQNKTKFQFTQSRYFFNIYGDKENYVEVQTVPRSNHAVNLSILSGNDDNLFIFQDGTLMVNELKKNVSKYSLKIQAESDGSKDTSLVDIFVMEGGKNGLVFDPPVINLTIESSSLKEDTNCLARVQAHVRDNVTEQVITYAGVDDEGYFKVDDQGCLKPTTRLQELINEYARNNQTQWIVEAMAFVYDDGSSLRRGNTTINIKPN